MIGDWETLSMPGPGDDEKVTRAPVEGGYLYAIQSFDRYRQVYKTVCVTFVPHTSDTGTVRTTREKKAAD